MTLHSGQGIPSDPLERGINPREVLCGWPHPRCGQHANNLRGTYSTVQYRACLQVVSKILGHHGLNRSITVRKGRVSQVREFKGGRS